MKTTIVLILLIITSAYPQRETLFNEMQSGGFGGPDVKFTPVHNSFGVMVGGYGGWLLNHTFFLGGGGYGLVNDVKPDDDVQNAFGFNRQPYLNFGYGGVIMEYYFMPEKLVNYSASVLIGGGQVSYRSAGDRHNLVAGNSVFDERDEFFVIEPGVSAELNATDFMKIGVNVSYRLVTGVNMYGVKDSDLSNVSAGLSVKFGSF